MLISRENLRLLNKEEVGEAMNSSIDCLLMQLYAKRNNSIKADNKQRWRGIWYGLSQNLSLL